VTEGSVFQRSDGKWCGKYKDISGKWRYLYRKNKSETKAALREALKDRDEGIVPANKMTVAHAVDSWLENNKDSVSIRTWGNRESLMRNHVKSSPMANTKLVNLTSEDLRKYFQAMLRKGLSDSTIKQVHAGLKQACNEAVRSKLIRSNPLDEIRPPKQNSHAEMTVLTPKQVRQLLAAVRGDRFEGVIILGTCGLRVGEALSIRWEDVSLNDGTLQVRRTLWRGKVYPPKTPHSRRLIKLPTIALEALTRHAEKHGHPTEGYMFATRTGNPVAASNFHTHSWKPALRKAGLPDIHFHHLRHGAASLLLSQNLPVPIVSRYLGHSNPSTTMRVYAHVIDGMGGLAATGIDDALS
jgi:integrase